MWLKRRSPNCKPKSVTSLNTNHYTATRWPGTSKLVRIRRGFDVDKSYRQRRISRGTSFHRHSTYYNLMEDARTRTQTISRLCILCRKGITRIYKSVASLEAANSSFATPLVIKVIQFTHRVCSTSGRNTENKLLLNDRLVFLHLI